MNTFTKGRLLTIVIVLLLIANIATLAFFWWQKDKDKLPPNPNKNGGPFAFLVKELALDSNQQAAYKELRNQHQQTMQSFKKETRDAKDSLFGLLQIALPSDALVQQALQKVGEKEIAIQQHVFEHFKKVRALCNEEQKKKFDLVIQEAMRMIANQRPQGIPKIHEGHDNENRPPPPHDRENERRPPPPEGRDNMPPPPPKN